MKIILGSQSPRRKEILSFFSLAFEQIPSLFDEDQIPFQGDPQAYAHTLALAKARELAQRFPQATILTADTVVYHLGKIYNKPRDGAQAACMLKELSGQWHQVFTALTLYHRQTFHSGIEESKILFNTLTDEHIAAYHQHCHFLDKAGGYGIQQAGSILVKKIEGCYYNVMGLPTQLLKELLGKIGIDLWSYLKTCY